MAGVEVGSESPRKGGEGKRQKEKAVGFRNRRRVVSCVQVFATPWTVACQAPLSMGFSRQE